MWFQRRGFHSRPIGGDRVPDYVVSGERGGTATERPDYVRDSSERMVLHARALFRSEGSNGKEEKMSADTTTDRLTEELKGKTAVLGTNVAEVLTKMEAVFADAHTAVNSANAHLERVAAAVARLKETVPVPT